MPRTKTRKPKSHLSPKQIVALNAKKYHVPFWILWGVAGAESTWGKGGSNLFGLTAVAEEHPNVNVSNWWEASALSAQTLARLKHTYGSWQSALEHYSGGSYGTAHVKQLAKENGVTASTPPSSVTGTIPVSVGLPEGPASEWLLEQLGKAGIIPKVVPPGTSGVGPNTEAPGLGSLFSFPEAIIEAFQQFTKLSKLISDPKFWIRVGEAVGGIILLYIALRQLAGTGASDIPGASSARQYAKAAAFKALPPKQKVKS